MGDHSDFPPPTQNRGIGQWFSDLWTSKEKNATKSAELFQKTEKTISTESKPAISKPISKAPSFFRSLDFFHLFTKPKEEYVIYLDEVPFQAERKALDWFKEQYALNTTNNKSMTYFSQKERQIAERPGFQKLASEFCQQLLAAKTEDAMRKTCLECSKKIVALAQSLGYQIAADDLVPLTILLVLKADDPSLIHSDQLKKIYAMVGKFRQQVILACDDAIQSENYTQCAKLLKQGGLDEVARTFKTYLQNGAIQDAKDLIAREKDNCLGQNAYALMNVASGLTALHNMVPAFASEIAPEKVSAFRQKSTVSTMFERCDFLHVFHSKIECSVKQMKDYTGISEAAKLIASASPHCEKIASFLKGASFDTFEQRKALVAYLSGQLAAIGGIDVHQDRDKIIQNELLHLLLVRSLNPYLVSHAFEDQLKKDVAALPKTDVDLYSDNYYKLMDQIAILRNNILKSK